MAGPSCYVPVSGTSFGLFCLLVLHSALFVRISLAPQCASGPTAQPWRGHAPFELVRACSVNKCTHMGPYHCSCRYQSEHKPEKLFCLTRSLKALRRSAKL